MSRKWQSLFYIDSHCRYNPNTFFYQAIDFFVFLYYTIYMGVKDVSMQIIVTYFKHGIKVLDLGHKFLNVACPSSHGSTFVYKEVWNEYIN
jgi:hypothetical protein